VLSGHCEEDQSSADVDGLMLEIKAVMEEEQARRDRLRAAEADEE
jgi:RIO kinase 1